MLETSLYARTNGYIKERLVDIGDRVKAGQQLALIAAPDVDDQLAQSKADLGQAEANLKLNKANAESPGPPWRGTRRTAFRRPGATGRPGPGRRACRRASVKAAEASILVYKATVQRYADLLSSRRSRPPSTAS